MTDINIVVEMESKELESDKVLKQINDLKDKLKEVKKIEKKINRSKPKQPKEPKEPKQPKPKRTAEEQRLYMRKYMKEYTHKNKEIERSRRLTNYYIKKFNIPADFKNDFNTETCKAWKAINCMKEIKNEHPELYAKLFKYI